MLGKRLKALRIEKGITLQSMSDKSGFSIGYLSKVERDITSPTVKHLEKLCEILECDLQHILSDKEDSIPVMKKYEQREILYEQSGRIRFEKMNDPRLKMQGIMMIIDKENQNAEDTWKHQCDEFGIIVKGILQVYIEDEGYELHPGDTIYIHKGKRHRYQKLNEGECISYWVLNQ